MGGCACSKAASSENLKAEQNESNTPTTDNQPISKRSGSGKKKDAAFSSLFRKNPSKSQLDACSLNKSNNSEQLTPPPNTALSPQQNNTLSPILSNNASGGLIRNSSTASWSRLSNNFYSLADLPVRTRLLLTSHGEYHDAAHWPQARINREIQIYQCSPFLTASTRRLGPVGKHNLTLIEAHLNSSLADQLFIDLRRSCADHSRNCDLNLININSVGLDTTSTTSSSSHNSLAHNKYFRRMLGKAILGELLPSTTTSSVADHHNHHQTTNNNYKKRNYLLNYLPGYNLFEILLSEEQFKRQDRSGFVLSESMSVTDAETFLAAQSSHGVKDLFNKWYKLDNTSSPAHYRLTIDFLSLTSSQLVDQMQADLDSIVHALLNSDAQLRQAYVKSVQQEEIEYIVKHADSASIIWINLTGTSNSANDDDQNDTYNEFNSWRYTQCLNLLVKKVLTNNYKQMATSEEDVKLSSSSGGGKQQSALNEFVTSSLKCIIDSYVVELNKNYYQTFALKIDKQLAQEIYHHYELYAFLASRDAIISSGEQKLVGVLDEYLRSSTSSSSTSYPLLVCNNDITDLNYFDLYVAKWMRKLIHENSTSGGAVDNNNVSSAGGHHPISIVYRFANHTVLASEMATLIQSMLHQCAYLLEVHESTAFSTPVNSVENLCKSLCAFQSALAAAQKTPNRGAATVLIVLNSIDKLLHTQHDLNLLVEFLTHLYSPENSAQSLVKLVMTVSSTPTVSTAAGHQTPTKTSKLISQLFVKLENLFKNNNKVVVKLSVSSTNSSSSSSESSSSSSLYSVKLKQINELREKLNKILFTSNDAKLLELLLYLLKETRFGLKQTEIIDLLNAYSSHSTSSGSGSKRHNHLIPILWYTFKYHLILFDQMTSLTEFLIDDNRLLFKLGTYGQGLSSPPAPVSAQFNDILHAYFAVLHTASSRRSSLASLGTDKQRALFASRAFHEHAKFFYLKNYSHSAANLDQLFLSEFVLSGKWMLNKATACSGLLYFVNDLNFFKSKFVDEELSSETGGSSGGGGSSITIEKFKRFERFFYDNFYALNQNPNEMDMLVRLSGKEKEFESVLAGLGNRPDQIRIQPINRAELIDQLSRVPDLNFALKKEHVHFSRVMFINKYTVLTLADQPHNEIKVWRVERGDKLVLLRSIKLNKPPKEIKLFNEHQGVALCERNLHLIDLDQCVHMADLNHTMNPNFPLFEIHDARHVVVLSRNRLTVSLMELPVDQQVQAEDGQTSVRTSGGDRSSSHHAPGTTAATAGGGFMFKVGEDRYLQSLLVSRNGKMMVCGDEVQKPFPLLVWDLVSRKLVHDLRIHNHEFITSIQAVSYSGKYVICACQESGESTNCLIVYDLTTGKMTKKLKSKSNYCSVEISEELDVIIACLENSQLFVYDLTTGSKKCAFNSNRYPINKIKVLTKNKSERCHYFVTYDTAGYDWTIRLWDINKEDDQLVSSFTCPSRVVALDVNSPPFYFDESGRHTQAPNDQYYIAASLYGSSQLLLLRLAASTTTTFCADDHDKSFASPNLIGHHNEISL